VYAVPDALAGDRVMVALEMNEPDRFDVDAFDRFLSAQSDLGPKWRPDFVRVSGDLPKLASMKVDKTRLRREAWNDGTVYWRANRNEPLRHITPAERGSLP
jgi:fatty-acyl-CoA synthase